jgi:hypothetical protein
VERVHLSDLCSKTFSDVLYEGVCPCQCDVFKEASSLQVLVPELSENEAKNY